ncbi:YtxH domain-containing protein [Candidatus Poribacteria bacterium]|nr:YtxH domain-containing protein [Candidatus Poribacteria bacterium]
MAESGNSTGTVILAFLVGGVIGAGVALLFAPASGEETRRRIKATSDDVKRKTEEFIDESRERIAELVEDGSDRIAELVEQGKSSVGSLTASLKSLVDEGKKAYRARRNELTAEGNGEGLPEAAPSDEPVAT